MHFARIESGKVTCQTLIPTDAHRRREDILDDVLTGIDSVLDKSVRGIGIGVPGLVDTVEGVVLKATNIPCIEGIPLGGTVKERFGLPALLGNDANCFALGEKHYGKGKDYDDVVGITLGTGVGAGIIVGGRVYEGNCAMAGEFGSMGYLDSDFETYCSGKFFMRRYGDSALNIAQAAADDDTRALGIFREYGRHVGNLLHVILLSCAPSAIILGGSLTKSHSYFRAGMEETLSSFPYPHVIEKTCIDFSEDPHMPVLGAAALTIGRI